MRLSRKCEYACLAIIELAKDTSQLKSLQQIAQKWNIPKKFLEQIMLVLKNTGYVKSVKGSSGGYVLKKHPSEITIAEIVRLFDGPLAPVPSVSEYFYEPSPIEKHQKFYLLMKEIRDMIAEKLELVTFEQILE
ncbi:MAG: Rrf2 family transcriptional regulator [Bacteroidales bacterium]|nr:Rrf2 family transcriptional regulator [Bacteroidales bacterium]